MPNLLDHQYKTEEVAYLDCKPKLRNRFWGAVFWGLFFSIMFGFMALAAMAAAELRWSLEVVLAIAAIPTILGIYWTIRSSKKLYQDLTSKRVEIHQTAIIKKHSRRRNNNHTSCYLVFEQQPVPDKEHLVNGHIYQQVEVGQFVEAYFGSHSKEFVSLKKLKEPTKVAQEEEHDPMQRSSTTIAAPSPKSIHESKKPTEQEKDSLGTVVVKTMLLTIIFTVILLALVLGPMLVFSSLGGDWLGILGGIVVFLGMLWLAKLFWEKFGEEKLMIKK